MEFWGFIRLGLGILHLKTHNWRVFKVAVVICCPLLALLAGCVTGPDEPVPAEWSDTNEVSKVENPTTFKPIPPAAPTNPPPVAVRTNHPVVITTNRIPATNNVARPNVAPVYAYTWTSLRRWATAEKLDPPRLLTRSPLVTYSISSPRGAMVLAIGSREATWNGLALHLGYAPETIDGEIFVHGLDLQKSLAPFLIDPPVAFSTNRVIVVDPGHGGINAGTISVNNRHPEKEYTLDWARRLQPLLEQEGWRVYLTRSNDVDLALSNRVTVAENHHADLFISLHFNSVAPDQKPVGLATFCLTPAGMPSNVTRGYPDFLYQSFANNYFDAQNIQLAEAMQRSLLHATGMEDRGINRARFIGVLRGQRRPSVLIEAGFLSNPHEASRIDNPEFRQRLAEAVAAVLK